MAVLCLTELNLKILIEIEIPDGSTHYFGSLRHSPLFLKKEYIGVVGAHWFTFDEEQQKWILFKHGEEVPHWAKELPKQQEKI